MLIWDEMFVLYNPKSEGLIDYKFFCFGGEPKYCQVISDRIVEMKVDFFDVNWKRQAFTGLSLPHKPHNYYLHKPICFEQMISAAQCLSKGIPFSRIDFYEINGRMYFGEITLFPASGFGDFYPDEWNYTMGDLIDHEHIDRR